MTSTFDFLMVLYSIIVGISMGEILTTLGHIIQGNRSVNSYWVHSAWVFMIFYLHVFLWFNAWQYATLQVWTMTSFFIFLLIPVILFLASVVALPEIDPDRKYDMRAYYFKNYRWMFGLLAAIISLTTVTEYLLLAHDPLSATNIARVAASVVLIAGIVLPKPSMHGIQIVLVYGLISFFTLSYRGSIGG